MRPTLFIVTREPNPVPDALVSELSQVVDVIVGSRPEHFAPVIDRVDAIHTWSGGNPRHLLEPLLDLPPRLRWIAHAGIGVDQILFPRLIESDVVVTNMRGLDFYAAAMAEYAFALILLSAKRLREIERNRIRREWKRVQGSSLRGKTLGIVGLGTIGTELAKRALAFEMKVLATRRNPAAPSLPGVEVLPATDLERVLRAADYVVLCAPRTSETDLLIGRTEFEQMKAGAVLINIARGRMVDEAALLDSLRSGHLREAALDVFSQEPLPTDDPLWQEERLFVSPHMSAFVDEPPDVVFEAILENVRRFVEGEPLLRTVDKQRGY